MGKKVLSFTLVLVMTLTLLPMTTFAAEIDTSNFVKIVEGMNEKGVGSWGSDDGRKYAAIDKDGSLWVWGLWVLPNTMLQEHKQIDTPIKIFEGAKLKDIALGYGYFGTLYMISEDGEFDSMAELYTDASYLDDNHPYTMNTYQLVEGVEFVNVVAGKDGLCSLLDSEGHYWVYGVNLPKYDDIKFVSISIVDLDNNIWIGTDIDGNIWKWKINIVITYFGTDRNNTMERTTPELIQKSDLEQIQKDVSLMTASDWAKATILEALDKGFIPIEIQNNYTNVITRQEFCRMAVKWVEYATGKDIDTVLSERGLSRDPNAFTDTSDPDILAAYALGITNGTGVKQFTPNGEFNREQAATMIMNTCKGIGADVSNPPTSDFTDLNTAATWAVDGINFVRANGIMQGTGGGNYSPKATYTREQSIITFNNIDLNTSTVR